jgi:hypothetical protein
MLLSRFQELECQIRARGWSYDVRDEVFRDDEGRIVKVTVLLRVLPGMTIDEIVSYQDDRYGRSRKALA